MRPPRYGRSNIPSQQPSNRVPFEAKVQADVSQFPPLQAPHPSGYDKAPPVYVVSTFDARPINATDFQTQSGNTPADTGFSPLGGPYQSSSIFFTVPAGYAAILRQYQILMVPAKGETNAEGTPIFTANGAGNVLSVLSFLVNGNFQPGQASITSWGLAFGDGFGPLYILANEGDVVEMRLTTSGAGTSSWHQALLSMQGNLLQKKGAQLQFVPGTDAVIPVHESAAKLLDAKFQESPVSGE